MDFRISIKTGSVDNAGTDADVTIKIYGSLFNTQDLILNEHKNKNVFEKESIDEFLINSDDFGEVEKIEIWHNNKWFGADWFLESCTIENLTNKKSYFFNINQWIKGNKKYEFAPRQLINYQIELIMGTLPGSGSNSNLFISLIGSKNSTNFINIKPLISNKEFISGYTEIFTLQNEDIGNINEIKLKTDSSGFNSNIYINRIKIKKEVENNFLTFPIFTWIKTDQEFSFNPKNIEYTIIITNGDVLGGGTDANVSMILYGTKGISEAIKLNDLIARNAFEAGIVDYLKISSKDLGEIEKIKIWHDEKWIGDGWFLNKITVINESTKTKSIFPFYSWLDEAENPHSVEVELTTQKLHQRPFYAIAHMVNTPAYVEEALDMGSNAVEFDITPKFDYKNKTFSFDVFHGFRPDFDPDKINLMERSLAKTELKIFLEKLKEFEQNFPKLSLVIYDCKLGEVPKKLLNQCGIEMAKIIQDNFLHKNINNRIYSIMSVGKKNYTPFFDGFFETVPAEFKKYFGADLSEESFNTTEKAFEQRREGNFWWGHGIASQVPKPLKHFIPQFLIAAKKRAIRGIVKKIYYWTLDDPDSMARILVTKLDGIIVNDPLKLLRVLEKEEFKHTYRLADRNDNPFNVI
ncbi:MAG: hypothetical protein IPM32_06870 [Ignavibacteriae bacterium]|nr:hypothetical protein [Ignavibacteriota bacterium]